MHKTAYLIGNSKAKKARVLLGV